jgi:hypothetical protein
MRVVPSFFAVWVVGVPKGRARDASVPGHSVPGSATALRIPRGASPGHTRNHKRGCAGRQIEG